MRDWEIIPGEALDRLRTIESDSVQACVTSPPYWRLRDYEHPEQLGQEATPDEFVRRLVDIFDEVRRTLRPDGTLWLNLGDCYAGKSGGGQRKNGSCADRSAATSGARAVGPKRGPGLKGKDLVGIPWMVAFALRESGWFLRADVVWSKSNPMPESVSDRPTRSHELVFMLTKSERYFYDVANAVEPSVSESRSGNGYARPERQSHGGRGQSDGWDDLGGMRRIRDVWTLPSQPFALAHFAVFPPALVERCLAVSSRPGDMVLDPFTGAGTTGLVALRLGRRFTGIELNPAFVELAEERILSDAPLLNAASAQP